MPNQKHPAITALIVDDEPLARDRLREMLERYPDVAIVGEAGNGREALTMIAGERPDLVFLDIQMPELDGFAMLRSLTGDSIPVVIFVTAFDEYAMQAFDAHAIDYLLKPFDRERFARAMDRARELLAGRSRGALDERIGALLEEIVGQSYLERIPVKQGSGIRLIRADDIDWIEAAGNYLRIHVGRERHLVRDTLTSFERQLDPARFIRIHRSTIVHLDRISRLEPAFHGDYTITLADGRTLTLTRTYRARLKEALGRDF